MELALILDRERMPTPAQEHQSPHAVRAQLTQIHHHCLILGALELTVKKYPVVVSFAFDGLRTGVDDEPLTALERLVKWVLGVNSSLWILL